MAPCFRKALTVLFVLHVKAVFVRSPFHNGCKPGLSHWGLGLELRRASAEACAVITNALDLAVDGLTSHKEELHVPIPVQVLQAG